MLIPQSLSKIRDADRLVYVDGKAPYPSGYRNSALKVIFDNRKEEIQRWSNQRGIINIINISTLNYLIIFFQSFLSCFLCLTSLLDFLMPLTP